MFAILAAVAFAVATLIAFTPLGGISLVGLFALGALFVALHLALGTPLRFWQR